MNRGSAKRERRQRAIEAAANEALSRREKHAKEIAKGKACAGCSRCLCQISHGGSKCGKRITATCSADGIRVAALDPHIQLVVEDEEDLINECLRLNRALTVDESTRILTGAGA